MTEISLADLQKRIEALEDQQIVQATAIRILRNISTGLVALLAEGTKSRKTLMDFAEQLIDQQWDAMPADLAEDLADFLDEYKTVIATYRQS